MKSFNLTAAAVLVSFLLCVFCTFSLLFWMGAHNAWASLPIPLTFFLFFFAKWFFCRLGCAIADTFPSCRHISHLLIAGHGHWVSVMVLVSQKDSVVVVCPFVFCMQNKITQKKKKWTQRDERLPMCNSGKVHVRTLRRNNNKWLVLQKQSWFRIDESTRTLSVSNVNAKLNLLINSDATVQTSDY